MIFLLPLIAAAVAPQPAPLKTFQDWTVGCDNGRACHSVALIPESLPEDGLTMSVRRGPGTADLPVVAFDIGSDSNASSLSADGRPVAVRLAGKDGYAQVAAADVGTMIGVLRSAGRLELKSADGKPLGTISLKGASAALLYMDDRQGRTGTATALVRPGSRAPGNVSPPALPVVSALPRMSARGQMLGSAALQALRRKHGCMIDEVGGPEEAEIAALSAGETLLLLACGSGAYNVSYVPFIVRRGGRAELAAFDVGPGWWDDGKPVLVNAGWDPERGLLTAFSKGRGLADCGIGSEFAWDGSRFRLVEQEEMHECRGSRDYITTWRARVVRR